MWLSKAEYRLKQITRWQYAAKGERKDPLKLGEGPFPMPFGQRVADVLEHFQVKLLPRGAKDPAGIDHLEFTTRRKYRKEISHKSLQLWVNRKSSLPVKILAKERKSRDIITVTFKNIKPGAKLEKGIFLMPRPRGWRQVSNPLKKTTDLRPR